MLQRPFVARLALTLLFLWALDNIIEVLCEAQWQSVLGFGSAFRRRFLAQSLLFCATAFGVLGLAAWPLRVFASLPPARLELPPRYAWVERRLLALSQVDGRPLQLIILVLAFLTARDAARHWPQMLLFNGDDWGIRATPWRLDASLWTFRLPGLNLLLKAANRAVDIALLTALVPASGRGAAQIITARPILPRVALRCLGVLGALWFACRAAQFLLAPFDLALSPGGFTFLDWQARRPVLWLGSALNLFVAIFVLASCIFRVRAFYLARFSIVALILPPLLLFFVPRLVAVAAWDEARREAPFRRSQRFTMQSAWALDDLSVQDQQILPDGGAAQRASLAWNETALTWLPLWDGVRLRRVARCDGAALQANFLKRGDGAHLIGSGVCENAPGAVLLDAASAVPLPVNLSESDSVNYGVSHEETGPGEVGDIALDSLFTRFIWAWRLRDARILAARGQRLMFRPDMTERARALVPFLVPGGAPVPVALNGRIVWMLDLLAVSESFPGARGQTLGGQTFNAARDSVKMVMDSATGETHFYAARPEGDPLLRAWQNAFPDLVQPFGAMPAALREHRRYPVELLKIQAGLSGEILGAKRWQAARQVGAAGVFEAQAPVYALDERGLALHATISDSDVGETSAAILTARCDGDRYGRLTLHRFDEATAPLDSGLAGPGAFDLRVREALQDKPPVWRLGAVRTLLRGGRVWQWQAIFREDQGVAPRLSAVVMADAAWRDGPVGVGNSTQAALDDWRHVLQGWMQSGDESKTFAQRLSAVLEPEAAHETQRIADLIAEAARLQDAAQIAEKSDAGAAARLRRKEREILESLRHATSENAPVELLPSTTPKQVAPLKKLETKP